jgi:hypothetical protein
MRLIGYHAQLLVLRISLGRRSHLRADIHHHRKQRAAALSSSRSDTFSTKAPPAATAIFGVPPFRDVAIIIVQGQGVRADGGIAEEGGSVTIETFYASSEALVPTTTVTGGFSPPLVGYAPVYYVMSVDILSPYMPWGSYDGSLPNQASVSDALDVACQLMGLKRTDVNLPQ